LYVPKIYFTGFCNSDRRILCDTSLRISEAKAVRFQSLDLSMIRPCFQGLQMYRKQPSIPDKNLVFWGYFFHFGG
jgi:hypothetical protein